MVELVVLGGGRDPRGCPAGSAYVLSAGNHSYLLDCGETCAGRLAQNGIELLSIRTVFLTHMHYDHMAGLFGLLFGIWAYCRREEEVPAAIRDWSVWGNLPDSALPDQFTVAAPEEGVAALQAFLPATYVSPEVWRFPLHFHPIHAGPFYADDVLQVTAYPNSHLSSQPTNHILVAQHPSARMESFSFLFELDGLRLAYSGDLGLCGQAGIEEFRPLAEVADVVISEVAHVPLESHLDMLASTRTQWIVLVHVHRNLEKALTTALAARGDRRFIWPENGQRIRLG